MKLTDEIRKKLEAVRSELERADEAKDEAQIGCILIAISQLVDAVDVLNDRCDLLSDTSS